MTKQRTVRRVQWATAGLLIPLTLALSVTSAWGSGNVFVVGNYPIEAQAANAVAAKERALAEGQQAAYRSLLRRLVPVTAYNRLKEIKDRSAAPLIEGFRVRSERNSTTEYIASYDFSFQPEAVTRLLEAEGIPYVDKQAPAIVVVPIYRAERRPANVQGEATDAWSHAWRSLDLVNTLTPVRLAELKREVHTDTIKGALAGDGAMQRILANEYQTALVVLAVLEPDAEGRRVTVTLAGQDSVGPLLLTRKYRFDGDLAFTSEFAAVISLGILEGRWKAANAHLSSARLQAPHRSATDQGGGGLRTPETGALSLSVSFEGMAEWQGLSRRLSATPGVSGLEVVGLSSRGARLTLNYPGGMEALLRALQAQGLTVRSSPTGPVVSAR